MSSDITLVDNNEEAPAIKKVRSVEAPLPPAHHAFTAPTTTGRLPRGDTLGQMRKGRSTFMRYQPSHDELVALRARRELTGLWHLNARPDLIDAHVHVPEKDGERDPDLIVFDGPDDPLDPRNWSFWTKCIQTAILSTSTLVCSYASSVFSTGTDQVAVTFGVSVEVSTLSTSLFLLGYMTGPIIFGPASELYGRRWPYLLAYLFFAVFSLPPAVAQNIETVMLARFFAGCGAAGPLTIIAGSFSDFWSAEARGIAMTIFGMTATVGPAVGPVMGNFITQSYLTWRWTAYIQLIWASLMLAIMFFFLKESYAPVLLQQKAKKIRYDERRWAVHAKLDERQIDLHEILHTYLLLPFAMLAQEPILLVVTVYVSFIYGILYALLSVLPYVYSELRGISAGVSGLVFISLSLGAVIGGCVLIFFASRYNRLLHETGAIALPKERCLPMTLGAIVLPVGFFLFGWTSPEYVSSPWPSIVAVGLVGFGFEVIFISALNLIVDSYLSKASSAFAANTMFRSGLASAFPLFSVIMFQNLGVQWASTLLGCLAILFALFPPVFYMFADTLIAKSKYAPKIPPPRMAQSEKEKASPV